MATQNSTQFYTSMTASGPVTKVREGSRVKPLDAVPSAQTVSAKNEFNNAQQANKMQAFNAAEKNHINRNYAAEMLPAMQKPRTVENVSNVATMQAGRVDKTALPEYAQYANDDVHQMASVYTATPGVRDNVDYSTLIRELSLQPATKENQAMMRNFLSSRNAKIAAGGEAMAQYANDEVTALAKGYLNQYAPEDLDTDAIYDKADALAERNYNEMERSLAQQQRLQMQNQMKVYEAQRRAADLAYARQSRGTENLLAEQGIGRGLGAAPSSGYSETARLGALANYSNDINQSYQQQAEAERALMAEFEQRRMQALSERNAQLMKNYSDRVAQMNDDRDYGFNAWREGRSFGNDDRRLDNESLIAKEQAKNLEAATVRQNIENDWYPKVTQSDIAYKDALTKGAIEDATGKRIDNQTLGARNQYESDILAFDAALAKAKLPMVDDFAIAALSEARNVGGSGGGGGGGRASSSKKKSSSGGSGGGTETYGDDIDTEIAALLNGDEADAEGSQVLFDTYNQPNSDYTVIEDGKVVEEQGPKPALWQRI